MHYVKHFDIDGVATRQVACIELHGKPNAATEGYVGVLGIDMDSPLHDVYKCVAVNGSIYTWDLLSSGLSIMSAGVSGGGAETAQFEYAKLKKPSTYVIKVGDLILDSEGYLYQINGLNVDYCDASYCGTRVVAYGMSAYDLAVEKGFEGTMEEWFASLKGDPCVEEGELLPVTLGGTGASDAETARANLGAASSVDVEALLSTVASLSSRARIAVGSYSRGTYTIEVGFQPKAVIIIGSLRYEDDDGEYSSTRTITSSINGTSIAMRQGGSGLASYLITESPSITYTSTGFTVGNALSYNGTYNYLALG